MLDYNLLVELLFRKGSVRRVYVKRGMIDRSVVAGVCFRLDDDTLGQIEYTANELEMSQSRLAKEELTRLIAEKLTEYLS